VDVAGLEPATSRV